MKAHTVPAALLGCTLCLSLLAGCGGPSGGSAPQPEASAPALVSTWLDVPPKEGQILADLNNWEEAALPDQMPYTGCEVIKRQSNPEDKEDIVYCSVTGGEQFRQFTRQYQLLYIFYDEGGWILEEVTPYREEDWQELYLDAEGNDIMESIIWLDSFSPSDLTVSKYLGEVNGCHYLCVREGYDTTVVYDHTGFPVMRMTLSNPTQISDISLAPDGTFRFIQWITSDPSTYEHSYLLLDERGNRISQAYDYIRPAEGIPGSFVVKQDGLYGLMDSSGTLTTDITYTDRYDLLPVERPSPPADYQEIPVPEATGNVKRLFSSTINGVFNATMESPDGTRVWDDVVGPDCQPILDLEYQVAELDYDNRMIMVYPEGINYDSGITEPFQLYDLNGNCRTPVFTDINANMGIIAYEGRCCLLPTIATEEEIYYFTYEWAAEQDFT